MATPELYGAAVDITKDGFNFSVSQPSSDAWSLGCDITIEDVDADIQEIRLNDIAISGVVAINEASIDINSKRTNILDLGVSVATCGISTSMVETQIVAYDDIVKISQSSPASVNETGYAASALSVKKALDRITPLEISKLSGILVNGIQYVDENKDGYVDITDAFDGLSSGDAGEADLSNYYTIKQTQGYVKTELKNYVKLEAESQTIKGDIHIDGNLVVSGDTSSGPRVAEGGGGTIILDTEMSDTSENGVQNKVIKAYVDLHPQFEIVDDIQSPEYSGGVIILDDAMSDTSENGVKNRVIKSYVDKIKNDIKSGWRVENGVLVTDYDIHVKANVIIDGDTSSSGEGENVQVGINEEQLQQYLDDNNYVTEYDVENLIPEIDLTPYAKTTDIAQSYATKEELNNAVSGIDLSPYATKQEVDKEIADLINGAPTTLDTLGEIATAFAESKDIVEALDKAIGQKANQSALDALSELVASFQTTLNNINSWYSRLNSLVVEENGNVRIKTNVIIDGDASTN
jgi:hypothetical protein